MGDPGVCATLEQFFTNQAFLKKLADNFFEKTKRKFSKFVEGVQAQEVQVVLRQLEDLRYYLDQRFESFKIDLQIFEKGVMPLEELFPDFKVLASYGQPRLTKLLIVASREICLREVHQCYDLFKKIETELEPMKSRLQGRAKIEL